MSQGVTIIVGWISQGHGDPHLEGLRVKWAPQRIHWCKKTHTGFLSRFRKPTGGTNVVESLSVVDFAIAGESSR